MVTLYAIVDEFLLREFQCANQIQYIKDFFSKYTWTRANKFIQVDI